MSTRGDIKAAVRDNLADNGVTFYTEVDLNESIQDAYDDVACLSQCISKKVTLNWQSNLVYYSPVDLGVTDYLGCTAIFSSPINMFLRDDLSIRDFDRIRKDWELWNGTPQFWAPSDFKRFAIAPHYYTATGTFDMYYWATAPLVLSDTDTFLIATDMHNLIEFYVTADLIEQAEEYSKAQEWWSKYWPQLEQYAQRVKNNAKADLLLRI